MQYEALLDPLGETLSINYSQPFKLFSNLLKTKPVRAAP